MIVDELIAILGFDLKGEGDLRKFKQGIDQAEKSATTFASSMGRLAAVAGGAFAAIGIGQMATGFVSSITRVNSQFESYEATLRTITGSSEAAKSAMDWIGDFARTTPYEAAQVTEAFVRMKAYGLDPMDGSLKAIGDASSALGKNVMDGVEAVADAITGENERLKEFGIRTSVAGDQITYSWTENGKEMKKTVRKDAAQIQAALMGIFSRFDGAMDEQSKTWSGMTSNLADNWTDFLREIGEAGYYEDVKRRLRGILDFAEQGWSSGSFQRIARNISSGLIAAMNTTTHLATQAYRIGAGFVSAAAGVNRLVSSISGLDQTMTAAGLGAAAMASSAWGRSAMMTVARRVPYVAALLAVDDILSGLNGDDSVIGSTAEGQAALQNLKARFQDLSRAASEFATSLGGIRETIVQSVGLPPEAFSSWDDLKARWEGLKTDFGALEPAFAAMESWAGNAATNFKLLLTDPAQLFVKLMSEAVDRLAGAFDRAAQVFGMLADPINTAKQVIVEIQAMIANLQSVVDKIIPGGDAYRNSKAQDYSRPIQATGQTTRAPSTAVNPTGFASLVRDGLVQMEGLQRQFASTGGIDGNRLAMAAELVLNTVGFEGPANAAKKLMMDMERTYTATVDANTEPLMAKIAAAKNALASLGGITAQVGQAAIPTRPNIAGAGGGT